MNSSFKHWEDQTGKKIWIAISKPVHDPEAGTDFRVIRLSVLIPGLIVAIVALGVYFTIIMTGPQMQVQEAVQTFEKEPLEPSAATLPVDSMSQWLEGDTFTVVPTDSQTIQWGATYYVYYCNFCHGPPGGKLGPVGESFLPQPVSILTHKTNDQELLDSILYSAAHRPLLREIIRPSQRGYLVRFVQYMRLLPADSAYSVFEKIKPVLHVP